MKKKQGKHHHKNLVKTDTEASSRWVIPFILIISFLAYIPVLSAGFVNWDDPDYVLNNLLIRDFSNIPAMITTPVQGNFHPLTMISLALNYAVSGGDAWSYHLLNLLLHLVNCFLVYRLAMLLSNRNIVIAFTTAVLFGIHPMHVESVAWISERKDVLFTLFFLAGLIAYTNYADSQSRKQYGLALVFLVLSLLSKPAAVVFPLVVFSIDLLRKRKLTMKLCFEKIPFVIPAFVLAVLTYNAQTEVGATGAALFDMTTRILMAFYGIMIYMFKLFLPVNLSAFYPFPTVNESLPVLYYLAPLFFLVLAVLFYFSMKKNRVIAFGIFFYLANLILVLQILPVGSAVISERYTYVPYIGIFYILGWLLSRYTESNNRKAFFIIVPVSILFSISTFNQAKTWHDGASVWDHAIKTNPSAKAYSLRASLLKEEGSYADALELYKKALDLNIIDYESYNNRGTVYFDTKNYGLAYADFRKAISLNPLYEEAYDNMGGLFAINRNYDSALIYLNEAIRLNPAYTHTYRNRALTFMELRKYDDAIRDFETYLLYKPDAADIYNTIGICLRVQSKFQEAIVPINKAIQMDPQVPFFVNRSYAYFGLKNMEMARKDALVAQQGGSVIDANYLRLLGLQ